MSDEMKKATTRRIQDWRYANRWFVGEGLDVGSGTDTISKDVFTRITSVIGYDHVHGHRDAQTLPEYTDESFDFVVSSHCLEHMHEVYTALSNWLRVLKPGGYLIVTVPEWDMYEHRHWPSKFNGDHKHSFTMKRVCVENLPGHVLPIIPLLTSDFSEQCDVEMVQLLTEHFDFNAEDKIDQTGGPAECAIEFVLRKV